MLNKSVGVFCEVTNAIDKGKPFDCIFLDFAKALHEVSHLRLLQKLEAHGVDGNVAKFIIFWLTGRRQRVIINGDSSSREDVIMGVPQVSLLGPLFFYLYQ